MIGRCIMGSDRVLGTRVYNHDRRCQVSRHDTLLRCDCSLVTRDVKRTIIKTHAISRFEKAEPEHRSSSRHKQQVVTKAKGYQVHSYLPSPATGFLRCEVIYSSFLKKVMFYGLCKWWWGEACAAFETIVYDG